MADARVQAPRLKMLSQAVLCLAMLSYPLSAAYKLEVTMQPVGPDLKGRPLSMQPSVRMLLTTVAEIQGTGLITVPQAMLQDLEEGGVVDVKNNNMITVGLKSNPTGADLVGRGAPCTAGEMCATMMLKEGVATFTDLSVLQGGFGFTLEFSAMDSMGTEMVTVESSSFSSGGQEAMLHIETQPILPLFGATIAATPPVISIVDQYGKKLTMANAVVTATIETNANDAMIHPMAGAHAAAMMGSATFDQLSLNRAATAVEASVPSFLDQTLLYTLRFSSPGFKDVVSAPFEVYPLMEVVQQPMSDEVSKVSTWCSGTVSGCTVTLANYMAGRAAPDRSLQTAVLDVDVSCTDLDAAGEEVIKVMVGDRMLMPSEYDSGPWEGCAFAGCRGECATNLRRVVSGMDVKHMLGSVDSITSIYTTDGRSLPVSLALSNGVNICGCDGMPLNFTATLTVTHSQTAVSHAAQAPLFQQPKVQLKHSDGMPYTLHGKTVAASISTNFAGALLLGTTRVMSDSMGVVHFTDLHVSEGAPDYVLRFAIEGAGVHNMTVMVDSQPFGVGNGSFPILSLTCDACSQPLAGRTEGQKLSQEPTIELQRSSAGQRSASIIQVNAMIGLNGPGGAIRGTSVTFADGGVARFEDITLLNGNCDDCSADVGRCGSGYTLIFVANGVPVTSAEFAMPGGNRSPRFIAPTPADGVVFSVLLHALSTVLTINATDENRHVTDFRPATGEAFPAGVDIQPMRNAWGSTEEVPKLPDGDPEGCSQPLLGQEPRGMEALVYYTPQCSQAPASYPFTDNAFPLCFAPYDFFEPAATSLSSDTGCPASVAATSQHACTTGVSRCFDFKIMTPSAPMFVLPYYWDAKMAGMEGIAGLDLPWAPMPPDGAGISMEGMEYIIGVGCKLSVPFLLEDHSPATNGTLSSALMLMGDRTTATSIHGQETLMTALPEGGMINAMGPASNPHNTEFEWTPRRGHEGFVYSICFKINSTFDGCTQMFYETPFQGHMSQFCLTVDVRRCRYCAMEGDTLSSIAEAWGSNLLQLWGGNPQVLGPSHLAIGDPIFLGPVHVAGQEDTLPSLAEKYGVTVDSLYSWNPDLPVDPATTTGENFLISSDSLYEAGTAPWAMWNGVSVPDSQEICFLPNICLFDMLPSAVGSQFQAFSCASCARDTEFCTGKFCVQGDGPPPWLPANCTQYANSRCERCTACKAEVFGPGGQVVVPGFFRSSGCNGTEGIDSICSPCSVCGAGEVEESPCTPLMNRKCKKVVEQESATDYLPV